MSADLEHLVTLQEHDTAIVQLQRRLNELPERAAAHDLNERRHAIQTRLTALAGELEALSVAEEAVEKELAIVEERVGSLDAALRSPGSATRDAQAIIHEVDQLREQASLLENRGLELLDQRDALLNDQQSAEAELEAVAADAPTVLAALKQAEGDGATELAALQQQRDATAAVVAPALLATYDRLRDRLGVAVARVVAGQCTGCHLSLAAVDLEQLAKLAPGQSATCEQCGRILIPS